MPVWANFVGPFRAIDAGNEPLRIPNPKSLGGLRASCRTLLTSNNSDGEWGTVFHDPLIATGLLDRVLHYSTTVNIRGES